VALLLKDFLVLELNRETWATVTMTALSRLLPKISSPMYIFAIKML